MDSNYQGYDSLAERRQRLAAAMNGGGGSQRLLGMMPLFGGFGAGAHSATDLPPSALPGLSFNPFLAQAGHGAPGVLPPSFPGSPGVPSIPPQAPDPPPGPGNDPTRWLFGGFPQQNFYGSGDVEDPWLGFGAVTS